MKSLDCFLPHLTQNEAFCLVDFTIANKKLAIQTLQKDWQSYFCSAVGYSHKTLPWSQLSMAQFALGANIKTICCCAPVILQTTHRGAYLLAQTSIDLLENDMIRIVAQINERLMPTNEAMLMVNKYLWLYSSDKRYKLAHSIDPDKLVGKDIFNFSYADAASGDNSNNHWQHLAMEIQMLIKQMQDYQGLTKTPANYSIGVHFYDCLAIQKIDSDPELQIPFINNRQLTLVSDSDLMKTFAVNTLLKHRPIESLNNVDSEKCVVIAFDSERDKYSELLEFCKHAVANKKLKHFNLFCADAQFSFNVKSGFFAKFF